MESKKFVSAVLDWFDRHGRHDLPWQQNPTAYRVWVSEIMLQQTQVVTVIPYYNRFMQQFPNVKSLALAPLDEVLAHWSGLGYYARARNLHRTAQIIQQQFHGDFPASRDELAELPGIGLSTAGAILSLGMQTPATILDGNVKRLFARYHAIANPVNDPATIKNLWQLAEKYTPTKRCNDYNQALMDLGAMICTRTQPKCGVCPLQKSCQGFASAEPTQYPRKKAKAALRTKSIYMLILQKPSGELLLEKRPPVGIWGGLWSLPECPLEEDIVHWCQSRLNMQATVTEEWDIFRHQFTHFNLEIKPILLKVKAMGNKMMDGISQIWHQTGAALPGGIPAPVSKLLAQLNK